MVKHVPKILASEEKTTTIIHAMINDEEDSWEIRYG